MKIKLKNGFPASASAVANLEKTLGFRIHTAFRQFLLANNGATPEPNLINVGHSDSTSVDWFIALANIVEERDDISVLPTKAYPIAPDGTGNFFYIDEAHGGAVFFWDHETDEREKIADDFDAFLVLLKPIDPNSISAINGKTEILDFQAYQATKQSGRSSLGDGGENARD